MFQRIRIKEIKCILLIFLAVSGLSFAAGCLEDDGGLSAPLKKYDQSSIAAAENIIAGHMNAGRIPGALVGIWQEGYETQIISMGFADIATGRAPSSADCFRIASNTKMFTAMAVLMMADAKKISLDDRVSKYVPDFPQTGRVSVRQLLNHTSGYVNYTDDPVWQAAAGGDLMRKWTPRELLEYVKDQPLAFNPGERHMYSNTGYLLLGLIIEKVSGIKWEYYVTEKILRPLMMNGTSCPENASIPGSYLKGYNFTDGATAEIAVDPSMAGSSGSMISNIFDMKKWLDAVAAGALISPEMSAEQKTWLPLAPAGYRYGLGLMLVGTDYIGHGGGISGYNSGALISTNGKRAVITVFNNEESMLAVQAAYDVAKYLFR